MRQVLSTGTIRSPHGVKGYVKVSLWSDDNRNFLSLKEATLSKMGKERHVEIEDIKPQGDGFLVKFKGIDSPEDARFISGWDILVPRERASRLAKDKVYTADLIGMRLVYGEEEVGEVVSLAEGTQALLLEVATADGRLHMVPLMRGIFVDDVDAEAGTMKLLVRELVE